VAVVLGPASAREDSGLERGRKNALLGA